LLLLLLLLLIMLKDVFVVGFPFPWKPFLPTTEDQEKKNSPAFSPYHERKKRKTQREKFLPSSFPPFPRFAT